MDWRRIVATMFYYGLKLISPAFFLVLLQLFVQLSRLRREVRGPQWDNRYCRYGNGDGSGHPSGMVAGANILGAYFGDKMSPLSDEADLASGTVGANLFEHIKHMTYTTVPAFIIALGVYWYLGTKLASIKLILRKSKRL